VSAALRSPLVDARRLAEKARVITVLNFRTATKWGMNVIPIRGIQGGHSGP